VQHLQKEYQQEGKNSNNRIIARQFRGKTTLGYYDGKGDDYGNCPTICIELIDGKKRLKNSIFTGIASVATPAILSVLVAGDAAVFPDAARMATPLGVL
jgi:hypothetical protein